MFGIPSHEFLAPPLHPPLPFFYLILALFFALTEIPKYPCSILGILTKVGDFRVRLILFRANMSMISDRCGGLMCTAMMAILLILAASPVQYKLHLAIFDPLPLLLSSIEYS